MKNLLLVLIIAAGLGATLCSGTAAHAQGGGIETGVVVSMKGTIETTTHYTERMAPEWRIVVMHEGGARDTILSTRFARVGWTTDSLFVRQPTVVAYSYDTAKMGDVWFVSPVKTDAPVHTLRVFLRRGVRQVIYLNLGGQVLDTENPPK